ncbi:MAG: NADP-dependent oxidoreductase [Actinomycetota bacterium]
MTTMSAVTFTVGGPERLAVETIERPRPGPTEVLVRVTAFGVNPIDWRTRRGDGMYPFFNPTAPMVLGWDFAGVVEEPGAGVTRFHAGDRVFGMPRFPNPACAYAEFVIAPARQIAKIPDAASDVEAAAVPLSGLTAYQAVVDTLNVGTGSRVLIHGAAGDVGRLAVQIAKARRAEVWATDVAGRQQTLRELGAQHPIDTGVADLAEVASEMDAVLDLVGSDDSPIHLLSTLRRGGRILVLSDRADVPSPEQLRGAGVSGSWMLVEPDHAGLEALAAMLGFGLLRVSVAETRPFAEVAALHVIGESGDAVGRLVAIMSG